MKVEQYVVNPYIEIRKTSNSIVVRMFSSRREINLSYDPALETLLTVGRDKDSANWFDIIEERHHISIEDYRSALQSLLKLGIVMPKSAMSDEAQSLSRQDIFFTGAGFNGPQIREKLKRATVLILGVGGIGANLTQQLVMVGVCNFVLVDIDVVDITNFNRISMFTKDDIGKPKVDTIKEWIERRVDSSYISVYCKRIQGPEDIVQILRDEPTVDLVVDCMDKPSVSTTGKWVSIACWERKIPHIIAGGYNYHGGSVGQTCIPESTPCSNCLSLSLEDEYRDVEKEMELISAAQSGGSYAPLVNLITSVQCMEIVRVLTRYSEPLFTNIKLEIDIENIEPKIRYITKHPDCSICF